MAETPDQIKRHIQILNDFETLYGTFIAAETQARRTGSSALTPQEYSKLRRGVLSAAPRADKAATASGYWVKVYDAPVAGGRLRSEDLSSQVMDFDTPGFSYEDDGLDIPRQILDAIPVQIANLGMMLEEAEAAPPPKRVKEPKAPKSREGNRFRWLNHPWVVGIGVTVIGGGILYLIVAVVS